MTLLERKIVRLLGKPEGQRFLATDDRNKKLQIKKLNETGFSIIKINSASIAETSLMIWRGRLEIAESSLRKPEKAEIARKICSILEDWKKYGELIMLGFETNNHHYIMMIDLKKEEILLSYFVDPLFKGIKEYLLV